MESAELEARIARVKQLDFNYNDALYKLVSEFIIAPYIPEMDKRFGKKHSISEQSGAGMTGSDTSALVITVPRERKSGFWNGLLRVLSPEKNRHKIQPGIRLLLFRRLPSRISLDGKDDRSRVQKEHRTAPILMKNQPSYPDGFLYAKIRKMFSKKMN